MHTFKLTYRYPITPGDEDTYWGEFSIHYTAQTLSACTCVEPSGVAPEGSRLVKIEEILDPHYAKRHNH